MRGFGSSTESESQPFGLSAQRILITANGVSTAGSVLNVIALISLIFGATGESLPVGAVVLVSFLPVAVVTPLVAGRLGRSAPRRRAVLLTAGQAALAGGMALLAAARAPVGWFYLCAAALGLAAMLLRLTILSVIPELVGRERLTKVNVLVQVSSQLGAVAGAGALAAAGGAAPSVLFTADAATFVIQGLLLAWVLPRKAPPSGARHAVASRLGRGQILPAVILLPCGFITLNALNVAMPLLALDTLHAGQRGFALAELVYPIAAVLGGLAVRRARRLSIVACLALLVVGWLLLAAVTHLATLLVGVAVLGIAVTLSNASTQAWVQDRVPRDLVFTVQSRAAAVGATVSAVAVLPLSTAFSSGAEHIALVVVALYFLPLVLATPALIPRIGGGPVQKVSQ